MKDHFPIQYRMIESGNKGEIIKAFFIMLYKNKAATVRRPIRRRRSSRNNAMIYDYLDRSLIDDGCRYSRNGIDFDSS